MHDAKVAKSGEGDNKMRFPYWQNCIRVSLVSLGIGLLATGCGLGSANPQRVGTKQSFPSNGEQIYFTATSQRMTPINSSLAMGMMSDGMVTCSICHGQGGRGGQVEIMMRTFDVPDIRFGTLTSGQMQDKGEEHPPYSDETIKRAITQGIDPSGKSLEWPMPRWTMTDQDLDDLVNFLKTLK
jgi:cytochrome c oxidase subunit II